jgi:hypothetical protein
MEEHQMNERSLRQWGIISAKVFVLLLIGAPAGARGPFPKIAASDNVAWLEKIASSLQEARKLDPPGGLARGAKDARTEAYARLGQLGTPEALAAIRRVETRARAVERHVEVKPSSVWTHPSWHYGDSKVKAMAEARSAEGLRYIITNIGPIAQRLYLLPAKRSGEARPRPMFLACPIHDCMIKEIKMTVKGDLIILACRLRDLHPSPAAEELADLTTDSSDRTIWTVAIADVLKDSDRDGWTDLEEQHMRLDPRKADSDGDGIVDGRDDCPDYAREAVREKDEEAQILQRAFFATYGLSGSRDLIQIGPKSRKLHLWGYPGPIIFNKAGWGSNPIGFPVTYLLSKKTETEAVVSIQDGGGMAAGLQEVILRKVSGNWVVVRRKTVAVS